jgi:SAM-dependent methyltransferase
MISLYREDLAYIQATAYHGLAGGAAPEIVRVLKSAAVPIRRVVDVGCGAGPLTAALIEAGFDTIGIDASPELLAMARAAAPAGRFVCGSVYDVEIPECDAVVAIGEVMAYHDEGVDADQLVGDFFRRASGAVPMGGKLIFDVIELGEPSLAGRVWNSGEDWAVLVNTEEANRKLVRNIETFRRVGENYRRGREVHHVRLFDAAALCQQLSGCGFEATTAQAYGAQSMGPRRRTFFATKTS